MTEDEKVKRRALNDEITHQIDDLVSRALYRAGIEDEDDKRVKKMSRLRNNLVDYIEELLCVEPPE